MNSIWLALMWKEWREHRWKLAALTAILLVGPLMALRAHAVDRVGYVFVTVMLYAPIAAAFLAMGAAAGERSHRTLPMLQALPLDLRKVAAIKLLLTIATFVAPIVITISLLYALIAIGETFDWGSAIDAQNVLNQKATYKITGNALLDTAVEMSLLGMSIICWVAALGVNRESEVRAGAIGLVVIVGLWIGVVAFGSITYRMLGMSFFDRAGLNSTMATQGLFAATPGGIGAVPGMNSTTYWSVAAPAFLLVHGALAVWYVLRFGRTQNTNRWFAKPTPKGASIAEWLDKPLPSPLRALAWKQLRESGPIIGAGLACAIGVGAFSGIVNWMFRDANAHAYDHTPHLLNELASMMSAMLLGFGFLSGLIAGVGASASDLQPRLLSFWRSRPINIDLWFWSKCSATLLLLFAAFVVPGSLIWGGMLIVMPAELPGYQDNYVEEQTLNILGMLTTPMLLGFASAMMAGCVLRHTVYAALVGLAMSLGIIVWFANLVTEGYDLQQLAWSHAGILSVAGMMTIAAWLATRFDWSLGR